MARAQGSAGDTGRQEESYSFEDSMFEASSVQMGEDWDTMMDEFFDEYEDYNDVHFPTSDDDF